MAPKLSKSEQRVLTEITDAGGAIRIRELTGTAASNVNTCQRLIEKGMLTRENVDDADVVLDEDRVFLADVQASAEATEASPPADKPPPEEESEEEPRAITRRLPCPLTDAEVIALGDEIDTLLAEAEEVEDERKSAASEYKSRLDKIAERVRKISNQRRGRVVEREIEVTITDDLARAVQIITRCDTGEVVEQRTLTAQELQRLRQTTIPGTEPSDDPLASSKIKQDAPPMAMEALEVIKRGGRPSADGARMLLSYLKSAGVDPEHYWAVACREAIKASKAAVA
jgi:hypothetical protein